jgi:tRNA threonylcarbamoyladenosine biosynthesis protein TsaE
MRLAEENLVIPDDQFCPGFELPGLEASHQLGRKLAAQLNSEEAVLLCGNLGAGKTSLAQGIVAGLNSKDKVTSPTFAICNIYDGRAEIHHYDLYRLNTATDLYSAGFEESLDSAAIVLVEWPDLCLPYLQGKAIVIKMYHNGDSRTIEIGRWNAGRISPEMVMINAENTAD